MKGAADYWPFLRTGTTYYSLLGNTV